MRKVILFIFCFCFSLYSFGQSEFSTTEGYKGSFEIGFAAGAGDAGHNRGEFLITNGYQFNRYFSAGIGTGIQVWQVTQQVTLPLFADLEATFMQKTISPYANVRLGYCFALTEDEVLPKKWNLFQSYNRIPLGNKQKQSIETWYRLLGSRQ